MQPTELNELLKSDNKDEYVLLDVRTDEERQFASIEPSQWIPMGDIPDRMDELDNFKAKNLVVYCHHGGRSAQVVGFLLSQGFSDVFNLEGGIDQWSTDIDSSIKRY